MNILIIRNNATQCCKKDYFFSLFRENFSYFFPFMGGLPASLSFSLGLGIMINPNLTIIQLPAFH